MRILEEPLNLTYDFEKRDRLPPPENIKQEGSLFVVAPNFGNGEIFFAPSEDSRKAVRCFIQDEVDGKRESCERIPDTLHRQVVCEVGLLKEARIFDPETDNLDELRQKILELMQDSRQRVFLLMEFLGGIGDPSAVKDHPELQRIPTENREIYGRMREFLVALNREVKPEVRDNIRYCFSVKYIPDCDVKKDLEADPLLKSVEIISFRGGIGYHWFDKYVEDFATAYGGKARTVSTTF